MARWGVEKEDKEGKHSKISTRRKIKSKALKNKLSEIH